MQLEIIRIVTDRLKHPTLGVNAMLAKLSKDLPTDVKPRPVHWIGDDTRDEIVASRQDPPGLPALYVMEDGPLSMEGETPTGSHRDTLQNAGVAIAVRYLEADADSFKANQARHQTIRAALQSLTTLLDETPDEDVLVRNGIQWISLERVDAGRWQEKVGSARVGGAIGLLVSARETNTIGEA